MNKPWLAKRSIQALGTCIGIIGLTWLCLGVFFAVTGIRDADLFVLFFMTPSFLVLGVITVAVAWQSIRHYGPEAIRHVVGLAIFCLYLGLQKLLLSLDKAKVGLENPLHHSGAVLLLMLGCYLLFKVLCRSLTGLAKGDLDGTTRGSCYNSRTRTAFRD